MFALILNAIWNAGAVLLNVLHVACEVAMTVATIYVAKKTGR